MKPTAPAMTNDDRTRSSSDHDILSSDSTKTIHTAVRTVSSGDSHIAGTPPKRAAATKVNAHAAVTSAASASARLASLKPRRDSVLTASARKPTPAIK